MSDSEQLAAMSDFRSHISRTILAYFRFWDFLTLRVESALGAALHEVRDEFDFWLRLALSVHGDSLRDVMRRKRRGEFHDAERNEFHADVPSFRQGDQVRLLTPA